MSSVDIEITTATCRGCGGMYKLRIAKDLKTRAWQSYCSPICEDRPSARSEQAEHERLKQAVVEAARAFYEAANSDDEKGGEEECQIVFDSVSKLNAFEASHSIEQKDE